MQDALYTVKVRITPAWARYIGEKIWHESQQTEKLADGSLELTFQVAGLEEIKRWIMGLGPEANVVEPEMLKDMVKADLRKTLIQYERIRPVYHDIAAIKNRPGFMRS